MRLCGRRGGTVLAGSVLAMATASTAFAQCAECVAPREGERTVREQSRQAHQSTTKSIQGGARRTFKSAMNRKLNTTPGPRMGDRGPGEATESAFTEPAFFGVRENGLSAGESASGLGAFSNVALTHSRSTAAGYKTDTDLGVVTLGIDKAIEDHVILGFAVSGSTSSATSTFEVRRDKFKSVNGSTAFSAAPYAAVIVNENVYVDATMGASSIENRLNHTAVPGGAVIQSGDGDAVARFLGAAVNYIGVMGDYGLLASAGYTWSSTSLNEFRDDQGNFVSPDDERASQLILNVEVGRPMGAYVPTSSPPTSAT